jgi:ABC-type phosphate/phosphonate transport system substrate-binding protein
VTTSLVDPDGELFHKSVFTGGHVQSVEQLLLGQVDACAVDSNGWKLQAALRKKALPRVRELVRLGPFVAQPLVISQSLEPARQDALVSGLTALARDPIALHHLTEEFGLSRFVPVDQSHFRTLRSQLPAFTTLPGPQS